MVQMHRGFPDPMQAQPRTNALPTPAAATATMAGMPTLLIADDHPLFRAALASAVRGLDADSEVLEADSLEGARAMLSMRQDIDLLLLDLHLPDSRGLMGLAAVRGEFPQVVVLMVSAEDDPAVIRRALAYGAAGYVPKSLDLDGIRAALDAVLAGEQFLPPKLKAAVESAPARSEDRDIASRLARLTPQQMRVLELLAQGRLNKQIADALGIQERTVKAHVSAIFERLDVRNRTQAGVLLSSLELSRESLESRESGIGNQESEQPED
jgi:DNA-binding NarL/FixJ family response regulator